MTDREFIEDIKRKIAKDPSQVASINGSFQMDYTASGDNKWYYIFKDGEYKIEEGEIENPDVYVSCKWQVYEDLCAGKLSANMAMMQGKLKFKGKMVVGMQLKKLLEL